jgi:hypothetical protein
MISFIDDLITSYNVLACKKSPIKSVLLIYGTAFLRSYHQQGLMICTKDRRIQFITAVYIFRTKTVFV